MIALAEHRDVASATLFQQQWSTYRKIVDNDYLFHRGAYAALRRLIDAERTTRFSFLDIACGDASSSAAALNGTLISRYCGIDLSLGRWSSRQPIRSRWAARSTCAMPTSPRRLRYGRSHAT